MNVEPFCVESYIKFGARRYPAGAYAEIPFEVKLSALLSANVFFRKLPYMKTVIEVRATLPGEAYKKTLPVVVGDF